MALVAVPSVLLGEVSTDTQQMVTLVALLAGVFTFAEYNATFPSLIEFRDAAPYNRLRFAMLASSLVALSATQSGAALPAHWAESAARLAGMVGHAMDFPYSPARLLTQLVQGTAPAPKVTALRNAAGMAYILSLSWLAVFAVSVKIGGWPNGKRPLNIWVNLPMFDPTAGADVVTRLGRDGRINILLGFLLPFLTPVAAKVFVGSETLIAALAPHSLIWIVSLWAFLPASLILRGLALLRIAELILQSRAAHGAARAKGLAPA